MLSREISALDQVQRVQVELESHGAGQRVKIRVENYDVNLGWYQAGSVCLPLCQLPLLEQAIEQMRTSPTAEGTALEKIVPFPGSMAESEP